MPAKIFCRQVSVILTFVALVLAERKGDFGSLYNGTAPANGSLIVYHYSINQSQVARVHLTASNSTGKSPLLGVFREKRAIVSVQLPIKFKRLIRTGLNEDMREYFNELKTDYKSVAKTLCPYGEDLNLARNEAQNGTISIELNSQTGVDLEYSIEVNLVQDFVIGLKEPRNLTISPSEPTFYRFKTHEKFDAVTVEVRSSDTLCATVSVQPIGCPVYDMDYNVGFIGLYQSMTTKASIAIQREKMTEFYLVFAVKPEDTDCIKSPSAQSDFLANVAKDRRKTFQFTVKGLNRDFDYLLPMAVTVFMLGIIVIFSLLYICVIYKYDRKRWKKEGIAAVQKVCGGLDQPVTNPRLAEAARQFKERSLRREQSNENQNADGDLGEDLFPDEGDSEAPRNGHLDNVSEGPSTSAHASNSEDERTKLYARTKVNPMISDMALKPFSRRDRKHKLYTWNILIISMFYGLPVVQLVMVWQNTVRVSGNMDICYYNFLCARPFFDIFAFNSIFSNIGYMVLGLLYILLVKEREFRHRRTIGTIYDSLNVEFGVPMHTGLLYAIGIAITMEGVLSASYHICPSNSNFQFDTAFMYIIGALGMLKIYSLRHPDINANSHVSYGILGMFIFLSMCGVYFHNVPFWAAFAVCYLGVMFIVSLEFYFKARWKNFSCFHQCYQEFRLVTFWKCFIPRYKGRFFFLLIGNSLNLAFVIFGVIRRPWNFPAYLLQPFIGNLCLYTIYYLTMKLWNKERLTYRVIAIVPISFLCWAVALYFYLHKATDWSVSAAESRAKNQACVLFDFYDTHDLWHFMSALALFTSFSVFLGLDDDRQWVRRDQIPVF